LVKGVLPLKEVGGGVELLYFAGFEAEDAVAVGD
jgi:hypothetical protein